MNVTTTSQEAVLEKIFIILKGNINKYILDIYIIKILNKFIQLFESNY